MSAARAPSWLKLARPWTSFLSLRFASTATVRPTGKRPPPKTVKRFIPEPASGILTQQGKLITTAENAAFFHEYQIQPDNGQMRGFAGGPELQMLAREFNIAFSFSHEHVLHPHDLRYFDGRGHPLSGLKRSEYAQKKRERSLWVMVLTRSAGAAVVRYTVRRRLMRSLHEALEAKGYCLGAGRAADKEIRGTLVASIYDPIKAARMPLERFGRVVGDALERQLGRSIR